MFFLLRTAFWLEHRVWRCSRAGARSRNRASRRSNRWSGRERGRRGRLRYESILRASAGCVRSRRAGRDRVRPARTGRRQMVYEFTEREDGPGGNRDRSRGKPARRHARSVDSQTRCTPGRSASPPGAAPRRTKDAKDAAKDGKDAARIGDQLRRNARLLLHRIAGSRHRFHSAWPRVIIYVGGVRTGKGGRYGKRAGRAANMHD